MPAPMDTCPTSSNAMRPPAPVSRMLGTSNPSSCACGARLKVIASIEQPELIERILAHLDRRASPRAAPFSPRAPPPPPQTTLPL